MAPVYGLSAAIDTRDGVRSFCGPTAIAAITGRSIVEVEDAILAHRKDNPPPKRNRQRKGGAARVISMWGSEVAPVCKALGWRVASESAGRYLTFAQWQRAYNGIGPLLILLRGHYVAVSGHGFVDSWKREPIPLTQAPHKRSRVVKVWRLEPMEG